MVYKIDEVRKNLKARGYTHFSNGVWLKPTPKNRIEWLKERAHGIGGSDIGTILGMNTFTCSLDLFTNKVGGGINEFYNRFTKWGTKEEANIMDVGRYYDFSVAAGPGSWDTAYLDNWENDTPLREIEEFPFMIVNEKLPWLIANIDGAIDVDWENKKIGSIGEGKNTTTYACSKYIGHLNPNYLVQVLTYIMVLLPILDSPSAKVFLRIDGNDMIGKNIVLNDWEELKRTILSTSRLFHNRVNKAKSIDLDDKLTQTQKRRAKRRIQPGPDSTELYDKFVTAEYKAQENMATAGGTRWEKDAMLNYTKFSGLMNEAKSSKQLATNIIKDSMKSRKVAKITFKDGSYVNWNNRFTVNNKSDV